MENEVIEAGEIQKIESQPIAVQQSPVMMLADKLAEGKITAEHMEKMLDVQIKWEKNEAEKAYHAAMADFQENAPRIIKDTDGHNCKYAKLSDIVAKVSPLLSAHGLSHSWVTKTVEGGMEVTCKITHELGHSETTSMSAGPDKSGSKNDIQAIGSTMSYLQRYTLKAALGLAEADQDDDGNSAGNKAIDIPLPTEVNWECVDAIIVELGKQEDAKPIDREKLMRWFFADTCKYPATKSRVVAAAEYVMQKNPQNIYKEQ